MTRVVTLSPGPIARFTAAGFGVVTRSVASHAAPVAHVVGREAA